MEIIKISNLTKCYKDLTAVNSLNLSIKKGDVHGILGPNGAGKSTLISCIVGLNEPNSGSITYENESKIKKWSKNIGYVPQELAIYPELSAYDNIKFFASLYGLKGPDLEKRVQESLDFAGLADVKTKKSSEFSGGMKRRLNLACAITHSPKLIIMDEPTVGIDPQSRNRILENVKLLNEQGVTIIYTTHYMEEVEAICNSITVIDKGNVIANGNKEEIMGMMGKGIVYLVSVDAAQGKWEDFLHTMEISDHVREVQEYTDGEQTINQKSCFIKSSEPDVINSIITAATQSGLVVKNIAHNEPSLEEIFLELTGKDLRD
ncbi:ABC transporter ATP-binding protein [Faecalicatena contorta]|uniref:ABC-2 type transport system ATP-binding protein n=1 Tax=Faecalicatena contorta TaxID=39482 RepID=A0A315ZW93_9FIRM|nr:ABC transporter ATP-binding protein [Faecalicatena contorta]PWJ48874.1 ABC-2 type transport system ATP-binding protein [Faecalicatena contorta]SUQ14964.1 ABC-2 type transport system ATP-binding protein [Faecalicatena contorta]